MKSPIEQRFEELIAGLTRKVDFEHYPNSVFFFCGRKFLFEQDLSSDRFWCDSERVWRVLECERRYNYIHVKDFIIKQVKKHFELEEITPIELIEEYSWMIEGHFNTK